MNPNFVQLEINGEPKGFKFGLGFLGRFLEATGIKVDEMGEAIESNPFKTLPIMVYESHRYNEERAKREFTLTLDDIIDWIDEDGGFNGKFITAFLNAWSLSMNKDVPKTEVKKKMPTETAVKMS